MFGESPEPGLLHEDKASAEWKNQKTNGIPFLDLPTAVLYLLAPPANCIALPGSDLSILK